MNRRESDLLICVYSRPFVVVLLRVGCGYAEPYSLMAFGPYLNGGRRRMIRFIRGLFPFLLEKEPPFFAAAKLVFRQICFRWSLALD